MMRNMVGIMKKVQDMQSQIEAMQDKLAALEFTAIVGGGAVSATVTGDGRLSRLKLNPATLVQSDAEILEDMICLATNNAHQQATDEKVRAMKDIKGGLPLPPGINLPF